MKSFVQLSYANKKNFHLQKKKKNKSISSAFSTPNDLK
jgi:hypothetical protein